MIECLTAPIARPWPSRGFRRRYWACEVAVVGADRGQRGVLERGRPATCDPLRVRPERRLPADWSLPGHWPAQEARCPAVGNDGSCRRRSRRGCSRRCAARSRAIVHSSSTAGAKGASCSSIASESRSICSSRKSRCARIAADQQRVQRLEAALQRLAQRRDLRAHPALRQFGEHLRVGRARRRARRASPAPTRRGCRWRRSRA